VSAYLYIWNGCALFNHSLLTVVPAIDVNACRATEMSAKVLQSEQQLVQFSAQGNSQLLYQNLSRITLFASVHALPDLTTAMNNNETVDTRNETCGEVFFFNAQTHADALRFVQRDPFVSSLSGVDNDLLFDAVHCNNHSITVRLL
jgi:hypothetical protein